MTSRWGWSPEKPNMWLWLEGWNSQPHLQPWEGVGLEIELYKNSSTVRQELPGWWTHWCAGWWCDRRGPGSSEPPCSLALYVSSIWQFLSCIPYTKPVNWGRVFPWVLWVVLADYWTWGGRIMGALEFVVGQTQVWVPLGPAADDLPGWHPKWGQSCRTEL